ncbi:unnamed protein product [Schistosoma curassoni]|uniref:Uncharacterized protein n=1 Tax=Schistosoma curassoni TaxID=6186 RepID=A0A183KDU5_9TREM|nr:unnamed protein product [Schistosoma curassoni]
MAVHLDTFSSCNLGSDPRADKPRSPSLVEFKFICHNFCN